MIDKKWQIRREREQKKDLGDIEAATTESVEKGAAVETQQRLAWYLQGLEKREARERVIG